MNEKITLAVRGWAEMAQISPADFARVAGYSYNHAYQMLKGDGMASVETVGRIAIHFGVEAVADVLQRIEPTVNVTAEIATPGSISE